MKGSQTPGFFRYALSGDLWDEQVHWGLGNTVFATKCYYTLGLLDAVKNKDAFVKFIKSFQTENGMIFDPLVKQHARLREKLSAIRYLDFSNFFHTQTMRAETRQAICALTLLGTQPDRYPSVPISMEAVNQYLSKLDWKKPWNAGSHFSHLLFFWTHSDFPNRHELIDDAIGWLNRLQDPKTGAWFKGNPSTAQKVNGAMKVLTGLKAANRLTFDCPEKLIDLALEATNDRHACDNFNVVYVLKCADELTHGTYRHTDIEQFARERLNMYQKYYWPEWGGFSYFLGKANDIYYNAAVSHGLPEPDIHGTVMFCWGIALISQLLGIDKELGFKEFLT